MNAQDTENFARPNLTGAPERSQREAKTVGQSIKYTNFAATVAAAAEEMKNQA